MRLLGKLLGLWVIGRTVSSTTPLIMRLISAVAAIAALAAVGMLVFAILMVGGVWATYNQLVAHDFTQGQASAMIGAGLVIILVGLVIAVQQYMERVHLTLRKIAFAQAPVGSRVSGIFEQFTKGYSTPPTATPRKDRDRDRIKRRAS